MKWLRYEGIGVRGANKKRLAALLSLLLFTLWWGLDGDDFSYEQRAIVRVLSIAPDGSNSGGSGVAINEDGEVLTVYHVVRSPGRSIFIMFADGRKYLANVKCADPAADLAIVRPLAYGVKFKYVKIARYTKKLYRPLRPVVVAAFPWGGFPMWFSGRIATPSAMLFGAPHVFINIAVDHGFSGAPVMNKRGKCIGIIRGYANAPSEVLYIAAAIPLERILGFLDLFNVEYN
jgi:S1-C subfamily serine protease